MRCSVCDRGEGLDSLYGEMTTFSGNVTVRIDKATDKPICDECLMSSQEALDEFFGEDEDETTESSTLSS